MMQAHLESFLYRTSSKITVTNDIIADGFSDRMFIYLARNELCYQFQSPTSPATNA